MTFTGMLCLQIYYGLLLKELKKSYNVTVWSIIGKDHESFVTGEVLK